MKVFEVEIYLNPISGTSTEQFLAEDWKEANQKAQKLLENAKTSNHEDEEVEILRLEKLHDLTEV